jgi:hypothetical protein
MSLQNAIISIINDIPREYCFDSHFIIQQIIEKYSDEYLEFASSFVGKSTPTLTAHSQIGFEIQKLCKTGILLQLDDKSWSFNIHHIASENTLYKKQ